MTLPPQVRGGDTETRPLHQLPCRPHIFAGHITKSLRRVANFREGIAALPTKHVAAAENLAGVFPGMGALTAHLMHQGGYRLVAVAAIQRRGRRV